MLGRYESGRKLFMRLLTDAITRINKNTDLEVRRNRNQENDHYTTIRDHLCKLDSRLSQLERSITDLNRRVK